MFHLAPFKSMQRMQNLTPDTYATTQLAGQKRKRNRIPVSCQQCRARKVACDKQRPCSTCVRDKAECVYGVAEPGNIVDDATSGDGENGSAHGSIPEHATVHSMTVERRLERLERVADSLAAKVGDGQTKAPVPTSAFGQRATADGNSVTTQRAVENTNPYSEPNVSKKCISVIYYIGKTGWSMVQHDVSGCRLRLV